MALTRRARGLLLAGGLVVVLVAAVAVYRAVTGTGSSPLVADKCTVGGYDLDPDQSSVAATMIGAVTSYRTSLPVRAQVLVLAAALQESKLRNIPPGQGDRDSVGVLQQRPSQGWGGGSAQTLTNVREATTEFLAALVKVPGWQRMSAAEAIQTVQISADGSLYAQHERQASAMAAALSGRRAAAVSCEFDAPTVVASAKKVATEAGEELGISTPTADDSQTVRVPGAGWQTAAWLVANSDRLGIDSVSYAKREWTREKGWTASAASEAAVTARMARV